MDISRLPVVPLAPPASASSKSSARVASAEGVESPRASRRGAPGGEGVECVVQGELLQRERTLYQSTRAYLSERSFENALSSDRDPDAARQGRSAIFHYLNNTRPEAIADLTQGQTVNYFV
jgi:hypothetical protein